MCWILQETSELLGGMGIEFVDEAGVKPRKGTAMSGSAIWKSQIQSCGLSAPACENDGVGHDLI